MGEPDQTKQHNRNPPPDKAQLEARGHDKPNKPGQRKHDIRRVTQPMPHLHDLVTQLADGVQQQN
jgi:hypothetical protein